MHAQADGQRHEALRAKALSKFKKTKVENHKQTRPKLNA